MTMRAIPASCLSTPLSIQSMVNMISFISILPLLLKSTNGFSPHIHNNLSSPRSRISDLSVVWYDRLINKCMTSCLRSAKNANIELQSDATVYGRGEMHLSAMLDEGDVVAYQVGSWSVDGVAVGTGEPASVAFCQVENVQVVWTHNCEHGVIRGFALKEVLSTNPKRFNVIDEMIEFGPEQLLAKIPMQVNGEEAIALVDFDTDALINL